mmetsp:Transcript_1826/g.4756  ORF Transcript_1826/g.4756 Transcript_1826/m.4756 type:complete len:312 (-) Transcript_1826:1185-2120(-)
MCMHRGMGRGWRLRSAGGEGGALQLVAVGAIARELLQHEAERAHVIRQLVRVVLVDHLNAYPAGALDLADVNLQLPLDDLHQRRLPRPILPQQADSRLAVQGEVCACEKHLVSARVLEADVAQRQRRFVQQSARLQVERQLLILIQRRKLLRFVLCLQIQLSHLFQLLLLHVDLARAAAILKAMRCVLLELVALLRAQLRCVLPRLLLLCAPLGPGGVRASRLSEPAGRARDVQRVGAGIIQKVAVVGHHHHDAVIPDAVGRQLSRQPQHGIDTEMVGGLIQQQQVRLGKERSGQAGADAPAAAECIHAPR